MLSSVRSGKVGGLVASGAVMVMWVWRDARGDTEGFYSIPRL